MTGTTTSPRRLLHWIGALLPLALLLAGFGILHPDADSPDASDAHAWGHPGRTAPGTFDRPRCVAAAPDGSVYCLDLTGRIQHFDAEGHYQSSLQMPDVTIGRPQGIDVDASGNVWVADTHYNQILCFSPHGEMIRQWGSEGTGPGLFFWPCAIHVCADGMIVTAEYGNGHDRLQVWHPDGTWSHAFGTFGTDPGQFMRPMGIAEGPDGLLYIADSANHRVQVFTRDGTFVRYWGGTTRYQYPYDLAIDNSGHVYVLEYGGHRLTASSLHGQPLAHWGTLGKSLAQLNHPWGLDTTASGTLFIADTYNYRVVCLRDWLGSPAHDPMLALERHTNAKAKP